MTLLKFRTFLTFPNYWIPEFLKITEFLNFLKSKPNRTPLHYNFHIYARYRLFTLGSKFALANFDRGHYKFAHSWTRIKAQCPWFQYLSPPLTKSLLGCPCILRIFFLIEWDLIGKPKDIFWQLFPDEPSLFLWNLVFAMVLQEPWVSRVLIEVVRQMWIGAEYDMGLACLKESCICDSGTITVS